VALWQKAASEGHVYAHIELAKYHEHRQRDYPEALKWTLGAEDLVRSLELTKYEHRYWMQEITHRKKRLQERSRK
jgi:hypothetical protein